MKIKSKSMRKKSVAILAGVAIAGAVGASAASLGGLTGGEGLGADAAKIGSCDTDGITVGYTTRYSQTTDEYMLDSIDFSGVDVDCAGQEYEVTVELLDELGASSQSTFPTVAAPLVLTGTTFSVDTSNADDKLGTTAESVVGLAVIISGTAVSTDTP